MALSVKADKSEVSEGSNALPSACRAVARRAKAGHLSSVFFTLTPEH